MKSVRFAHEDVPFDPRIEKAVLGGILLKGELIEDVIHVLGKNPEEAFYDPACRQIFHAMLSLRKRAEEINPLSVIEELKISDKLDRVGGEEFILSLPSYIPSPAHLDTVVRRLKEKMVLRQLSQKMREFLDEMAWGVPNTWEFVSRVEKEITDVVQQTVNPDFYSLADIVQFVEREVIGHQSEYTISSGFPSIDEKIVGFHPGDFVILAGRPGMGKTSFALTMAYWMARDGIPICFFSIEMPMRLLLLRLLSMHTGIPLKKIIAKRYNEHEKAKLSNAARDISYLPIYFNDSASGITQIRSLAKRVRSEKGVKAIFIDYIQQVFIEWRVDRREEEIASISRLLKSLAKEIDVTVIALSQLSREPERRGDNKRPQLSDLRESGSLEQDADLVVMLYRDHYYNPCLKSAEGSGKEFGSSGVMNGGKEDGITLDCCERARATEAIIAKNRNGPTGIVNLKFVGECCLFEDPRYPRT